MTRKIKVLWLHNFPPEVKNSGVFMYALADALRNLGVEIKLEYLGNLRNLKDIIVAVRTLRLMVKDYDVIHAQFGSACGWLVSKMSGIKILSLHGSDWYGTSSGSFGVLLHGILQRWLTRKCLSEYEAITVPSERMQAEVGRCFTGNLIHVPDGIDLDSFCSIERSRARQILGIDGDNAPWVLFPSIVLNNPVKRYWLAEQAYIEAKKIIPNLKLKIASNIDHKSMPVFFNASNVILMTSTHEGGPLSIKEALACNVPFVSTDVGDLKKISEQENSCFVVDADPKILGAAVVKAINQPRPTNLRKHIEGMSLINIAEIVLKLYKSIL